ncbi:hypothetical protein RYZ26_03415 [Terasakiella sp. A23]|uniref:hypothetical protein n=1 Tax=Terasakiella sp. FCG-A23 TaxID=3080561 RepID=UPI0029541C71|nr:hypothetical protein [Terasakiella sp. A23]MDV7338631.1 hypothetical protein [Terasakiella sp. A23]
MKKTILAAGLMCICTFNVQADEREVIKIPSEIKSMFLEEMRGHLDNLNEITLAISAGDFETAAFVAQSKMGFGRPMRDVMEEQGLPQDVINKTLEKMRAEHGKGGGMEQFMPEEIREMGRDFHTAAENFARVARSVSTPPTADEYQRVFTALSEAIDVCSACHSSFRVE